MVPSWVKLFLGISSLVGVVAGSLALKPYDFLRAEESVNKRLAIYKIYKNDTLKTFLENKGVEIRFIDSDVNVVDRIKSGTFGAAVVSAPVLESLVAQNLIKKIDWMKMKTTETKLTDNETEQKAKIKEHFIESVTTKPQWTEYGVPYFTQKLSFFYKNENNLFEDIKPANWSELVRVVKGFRHFNKYSNGVWTSNIAVVGDATTLQSIGVAKANLNEHGALVSNIPGAQFLNSGKLAMDKLAKDEVKGVLAYSGDALYSYMQGSIGSDTNKKLLQQISPEKGIISRDYLVINKNMKLEDEKKIYDAMSSLLLDADTSGCSGMIKNFHTFNFTPVHKAWYDKLLKGESFTCPNRKGEQKTTLDEKAKEILKLPTTLEATLDGKNSSLLLNAAVIEA